MLRNASAVRSLQDGCRRLGLPSKTAVGLVDFLSVKRLHDRINDGQGLRMSPGTALDKLWHWMLLNTAGGASNALFESFVGFIAVSTSSSSAYLGLPAVGRCSCWPLVPLLQHCGGAAQLHS
jgi:hypothetical protein